MVDNNISSAVVSPSYFAADPSLHFIEGNIVDYGPAKLCLWFIDEVSGSTFEIPSFFADLKSV
jgi:hypothetical protein